MMAESEYPSSNAGSVGALRAHWAWFVALGGVVVVAGVIALGSLVAATIATVWVIGVMLVAAGVVEVLHGLRAQAWGRFLWGILSGALYVLGGIFAIVDPFLASSAITLLIGLALIVGGAVRIVLAIELRHAESWVWVMLGGVVTLLCGVLIASRWPFSATWVIGGLIGINLVIHGVTWVQFGLVLRPRR